MEELTAAWGMDVERLSNAIAGIHEAFLPGCQRLRYQDMPLPDFIQDENAQQQNDLATKRLQAESISKILDRLTRGERDVISTKFGLQTGAPMSPANCTSDRCHRRSCYLPCRLDGNSLIIQSVNSCVSWGVS